MKAVSCFIKTFKENIRDWKILIIVFVFAPFFVYMMHFYLQAPGASVYTVLVLNEDGNGEYSRGLVEEWKNLRTEDDKPMLKILSVKKTEEAHKLIKEKSGDLFVTIPGNFSPAFTRYLETRKGILPGLRNYGDRSNVKFIMAASLVDYTAFAYIGSLTGTESPLSIAYESAGILKQASEFDMYVPALLVLSIIMILFTTGASIIREVEKGTIARLALSRLSSFEFMGALSLNQIIIGIACLLLTLLAGISVGYRSGGSILLVILIGTVTCFAVIGISLITVCFIKNMFGLLTLGCFPFFIMMFFSDCFMPMPKIDLFEIAGNKLFLNDFLPTATATRALQKVLVYGSGFADIAFELGWMLILSCILFAIGVLLFRRKYGY
jgi:ABC-2 type transport system permease protein